MTEAQGKLVVSAIIAAVGGGVMLLSNGEQGAWLTAIALFIIWL
jgi:hypothetical protein